MRLDNIQFDEPVDSSKFYSSLEEWVTVGISDFLKLMRYVEPSHLQHYDTKTAQIGALRECARLITSNDKVTTPSFNTLLSWYQYSLMQFISTTFAEVNSRLLPDSIKESEKTEYIEKVVTDVLSRHEGVDWKNPRL